MGCGTNSPARFAPRVIDRPSRQRVNISPHLPFASLVWNLLVQSSLEPTPIPESQTPLRNKIGHRRRCSHGPISFARFLSASVSRPLTFLLEGCLARLTPDSRLGETSWQMLIFAHPILNAGGTFQSLTKHQSPVCARQKGGERARRSPRWNPCLPAICVSLF